MKEEKKPIDVVQKMVSYDEFQHSLKIMKEYDLMMNKLRLTKSPTYAEEVAIQLEKEEYQRSKEAAARVRPNTQGPFDSLVKDINEENLIPAKIPDDSQNAFVVNLFCID